MSAEGTVDAANSKGVAQGNVTHPDVGVYCISGLSFTPRNAVTSVGETGAFAIATQLGVAFGCGEGTQISVLAEGPSDTEFMININN